MKRYLVNIKEMYKTNPIIKKIVLVCLPYGRLLSVIFFVCWIWIGVLSTMVLMDIIAKYVLHTNLSTYEQTVKWGERYIVFFPFIVYTLIFFIFKKYIFLEVDYYKKVLDCIIGFGVILLFGNQYWKIDDIKMFFGNEGFGGVALAALWFRILIILCELLSSKEHSKVILDKKVKKKGS